MVQGNLAKKVSNGLWRVGFEVRTLPFSIWLELDSNRRLREMKKPEKMAEKRRKEAEKASKKAEKKASKKESKDSKKEAKEQFKEADKAYESNGHISQEMLDDIAKYYNDDALKIAGAAVKSAKTMQLVKYAFYYMTDSDAKLIELDEKLDKEIINSIANIYEFGKIFEDVGLTDLEKFDLSSGKAIGDPKHILSIKEIKVWGDNEYVLDKIKERKEQLEAEKQHPTEEDDGDEDSSNNTKPSYTTDEDGLIHPVFFDPDKKGQPLTDFVKRGPGIDDKVYNKLETIIPEFVKSDYRYEAFGSLVNLYIKRTEEGAEDCYLIDPGIVMGKGEYCIISNVPNDTLFVPFSHKDIVEKIIGNKFYVLSSEEIQKVIDGYFRNLNIYRYIDMSKTEFLSKLSQDDFQKLGKKLTFILSKLAENANGVDLPRFRFNMFESIDNFMIISDPAVVSPLIGTNETSSIMVEGMMFIVNGDSVTMKYFDSTTDFKIEKYGEM